MVFQVIVTYMCQEWLVCRQVCTGLHTHSLISSGGSTSWVRCSLGPPESSKIPNKLLLTLELHFLLAFALVKGLGEIHGLSFDFYYSKAWGLCSSILGFVARSGKTTLFLFLIQRFMTPFHVDFGNDDENEIEPGKKPDWYSLCQYKDHWWLHNRSCLHCHTESYSCISELLPGRINIKLCVNSYPVSIFCCLAKAQVINKFTMNTYKVRNWYIHGLSTIVSCYPLLNSLQPLMSDPLLPFGKRKVTVTELLWTSYGS